MTSHRAAMAKPVWIAEPVLKAECTPLSASMLRALSVGMKILDIAKVRTWGDLHGALPERVRLSHAQIADLQQHEHLCALQRSRVGGPKVNVLVCSVCSRWMLLSTTSGGKPAKCHLSWRCDGVIVSPPQVSMLKEPPGDESS